MLLGEPGDEGEKAAASCNLHFPDLLYSAMLHTATGSGTPAEEFPQAEDRGQWGKVVRVHWAELMYRSAGTLEGLDKGNGEHTVAWRSHCAQPHVKTDQNCRPCCSCYTKFKARDNHWSQRGRKIIFRLKQDCWHSGVETKQPLPFLQQSSGLYIVFVHCYFSPFTFSSYQETQFGKLMLPSCWFQDLCFFLPCFCHGSAQKLVLPLWPPRSFHTKRVLLSTCHYRKTSIEPLMKSSTVPCSDNTLTGFSESIAGVQWAASIPSVEIQLPLSWCYS